MYHYQEFYLIVNHKIYPMAKSKPYTTVTEEGILNKIHYIRGQQVMIDRDLAEFYGVEQERRRIGFRRADEED